MTSRNTTAEEKLEIIKRICGLIIQSSVEEACKQVGIAESTFYAWVGSDDLLAEEYTRARMIVSYKGEAELERISRLAMEGECDPKAANVASQNTRWLMGRRNPKVYGDHQFVDSRTTSTVTNLHLAPEDLDKLTDDQIARMAEIAKESADG